jgi:hypothetical protein
MKGEIVSMRTLYGKCTWILNSTSSFNGLKLTRSSVTLIQFSAQNALITPIMCASFQIECMYHIVVNGFYAIYYTVRSVNKVNLRVFVRGVIVTAAQPKRHAQRQRRRRRRRRRRRLKSSFTRASLPDEYQY